MQWMLEVESTFEASHRLPEYNGSCRRNHGHSYVAWATWRSHELDHLGMAIDLCVLKKLLRSVTAELDHRNLNDTLTGATTAECICRYIWNKLRAENHGSALINVAVQETRGTKITYEGE
ncbi:hypothetical protein LCGC14_0613090 [marine sediment metagenome]|uniref:6-carboxy-5,6,7,8-tetrahydropterin synthase n=1 Tax=marine sediment metagenome TaxID=412755 RepID=A0A0F9RRE4_9ZZZZ